MRILTYQNVMTHQLAPDHSSKRFEFGKNWTQFLNVIDEERITSAQQALLKMLDVSDLNGKQFLDVGCGSGLSSLAAIRLGARVMSFDFDPAAVLCTQELKRRFAPDAASWTIQQGSVLDSAYIASLGQWDIVYSWGVLHHTGAMRQAIEAAMTAVREGGKLFIAIYNDQGGASRRWTWIKKTYNRSHKFVQTLLVLGVGMYFETRGLLVRLAKLKNPLPFKDWAERKKTRGMSVWYDLVDWVGGYPFEVAKPEDILDLCSKKSFVLKKLKTCGGGLGCNEFVFQKMSSTE